MKSASQPHLCLAQLLTSFSIEYTINQPAHQPTETQPTRYIARRASGASIQSVVFSYSSGAPVSHFVRRSPEQHFTHGFLLSLSHTLIPQPVPLIARSRPHSSLAQTTFFSPTQQRQQRHPTLHTLVHLRMQEQHESSIDTLPNELLIEIFACLHDPKDLRTLFAVCSRWRQLACDPRLWKEYFTSRMFILERHASTPQDRTRFTRQLLSMGPALAPSLRMYDGHRIEPIERAAAL